MTSRNHSLERLGEPGDAKRVRSSHAQECMIEPFPFLLVSANGIHVPVKEMSPKTPMASPQGHNKWQHQHGEILQDVWVDPKALLCVQESTGQKAGKERHPIHGFLVLPWGLGSEWLGVEFQIACTGGLPLKRREPWPSFSLLPAANNPEKLLAIYQDFHHLIFLDTIMMCKAVHLTIVLSNYVNY